MQGYNKFAYASSNDNAIFNNPKFIGVLVRKLSQKLGRNTTKSEEMYIINFLKKINPILFNGKKYGVILDSLVKTISEEITQQRCQEENRIDIKEMLKNEIGVSTESEFDIGNVNFTPNITTDITAHFQSKVDIVSLFGNKSLGDIQKIINPGLVTKNFYLDLDTRYRSLEGDGTTEFSWVFNNNETAVQGSTNAIGNIRDIIGMRIYPFRIPYAEIADNPYDRITMYISEFSAQSIIAHENRRYHFALNPTKNGKWIELSTDKYNDGYYNFRAQITVLESITISFGAPYQIVRFDKDRMNGSVSSYANPIEITTVEDHNLQSGDLVYINDFTTRNTFGDAFVMAQVNNENGNYITYVSDTQFTIDADASLVSIAGAGTISIPFNSKIVTGVGTAFTSLFYVGDYIEIPVLSRSFQIASIQSNTSLTLVLNFDEAGGVAGVAYNRNNILNGLIMANIYFGSKRIITNIEFQYYDTFQQV